ncbi:class II fructose-bisphosphate aldolase [Sinomonas mesophila]|uniref:class II fructose-bisphosphate aldolase n=1 Tax=Sinomonas mesophila TaxID=1531955 RepID=UPI000986FF24|nr:class II fructose-bisphosphate aldolase [Sinomonas mesophila]
MRSRLDDVVAASLLGGGAVPAFTCYDFATATAVVEAAETAAEEAGLGVVLNVAPKTAATRAGLRLIAALRTLADGASVPVCVQLDHAADAAVIADAVAAGADAVLADGSALPLEDNVAFVRHVRAIVGPDVVLEAELGGLAGDEDKAFAQEAAGLTDPDEVRGFVERSGAQLLAVAIGNVHGRYRGEPQIRWDVLGRIAQESPVPLVLHGASGIPAADLARAASFRVGKVNVNTELRTAVLASVAGGVAGRQADGEDLAGLLREWSTAAGRVAGDVLATLRG